VNPIIFLEPDELVEINRDQFARHGGIFSIRDPGAIESMTTAPRFFSDSSQ